MWLDWISPEISFALMFSSENKQIWTLISTFLSLIFIFIFVANRWMQPKHQLQEEKLVMSILWNTLCILLILLVLSSSHQVVSWKAFKVIISQSTILNPILSEIILMHNLNCQGLLWRLDNFAKHTWMLVSQ